MASNDTSDGTVRVPAEHSLLGARPIDAPRPTAPMRSTPPPRPILPEGPTPAIQTPPPAIQTFQYVKPAAFPGTHAIVELCHGENLRGEMHVLRPGASGALQRDDGAEAFWIVLRGRARVIGVRDTLIGEFSSGDGLLIPRAATTRFENVGPDDLEILEVIGFDRGDVPAPTPIEGQETDASKVSRIVGRVL